MSFLDIQNPLDIPEVQAYYEDVHRFKINSQFEELKFSKSQTNFDRLCRRLTNIDIPLPALLPYQTLTLEEIKQNVRDILNQLFDNQYKDEIEESLNSIVLEPIENPLDAILEEKYNREQLIGKKIHISDKLSTIEIIALAHEIIHALLAKYNAQHYNAHLNNLNYKELLSIVVEYIVCYELGKNIEDDLSVKQRVNRLWVCQQNLQESENIKTILPFIPPILQPHYQVYKDYIMHNGYKYIIGDVYARRLLDMYKDDPATLLKLVSGIINGDQQVKDLIKYYRLSLTDKPTIYGYYDSMEETVSLSKKYKKN